MMTVTNPVFETELVVRGRVALGFAAEPGDVIAVIGPNGAGKSTLVSALAGLVPSVGYARMGGEDLLALPVRRRGVGVVFQEQRLFPHLSARANVAFGPRANGVSRRQANAAADDWLVRFGIGHLADRRPDQLSGGQAQRVAIARALAAEPRLLLLDEPMAGLDVGVATALRIELSRHLSGFDGVTLLVTHDPLDALTVATKVLVVDNGRLAQFGTPDQVAQRPQTEHVARLVGLNVIREGLNFRAFPPSAVTVDLHKPTGSARNRWWGTVVSIVPHGSALRLVVRADRDLIADITPAAATQMGLNVGRKVWLGVKETSISEYRAPLEPVRGS